MAKKKVLIDVPPIHDDGLRAFEHDPEIEIVRYDRQETAQPLEEIIRDIDGVMVGLAIFDEKVINSAPDLKILAKHGVGYDNVDVAAASRRKIPVAVTPYANSTSVAEYTVGSIITLNKKIFTSNTALKNGTYQGFKQVTGNDIWGKTLGVIGIGRIGSAVVRMCRLGFNMDVIAYDPYASDAYANSVGARRVESLETLLRDSDIVSVHCPLNPETKDIIGEKEFKLMKDSAYLINSARGGLVNEAALLDALNNGWIKGVALDVLEKEPPDPENELLNHEKAIVTPHTAANTDESMSVMATMAAEEIIRTLNGERPRNIVNAEIYL